MSILITCPVLDRPHRAAEVVRSIAENTQVPWQLLFLCTKTDKAEIKACQAQTIDDRVEVAIVPFPLDGGDFARKTNYGISISESEWVFAGADDLRFHSGWDAFALGLASATHKRFIGTNDLHNPVVIRGRHSTHSLVARSYIEEYGTIDENGKLYHEGYGHAWCDNEAVETAVVREEYVWARRSHVEHLHPFFKGAPEDDTYDRGQETFVADRELLISRRKLWNPHYSQRRRTTGVRARPHARRSSER